MKEKVLSNKAGEKVGQLNAKVSDLHSRVTCNGTGIGFDEPFVVFSVETIEHLYFFNYHSPTLLLATIYY